jgi:hypothetical protein
VITPTEARQMRRAIVEADPNVPILLSGDMVAAVLGLTPKQLKRRIKSGDLSDMTAVGDVVHILARQVRDTLRQNRFSTQAKSMASGPPVCGDRPPVSVKPKPLDQPLPTRNASLEGI